MIAQSLFVGEYTRLAPIDPDRDAAAESTWTHNPDYARRISRQNYRPLAVFEIKKIYGDMLKRLDEYAACYPFAIRRRADDVLLGSCRIENIQWSHGNALLSHYLGHPGAKVEEWLESLQLITAYAFGELGLNRLTFLICENEKELAGYLGKVGFIPEVRQREMHYRDGQYFDGIRYGILYQDWIAARRD
ncbi:MAG: GNAT family N-acetyltransferase [Anaerolineae bacterium]|nr:GNAT family N-acetyltransferase [Anaerolineae bacterium]